MPVGPRQPGQSSARATAVMIASTAKVRTTRIQPLRNAEGSANFGSWLSYGGSAVAAAFVGRRDGPLGRSGATRIVLYVPPSGRERKCAPGPGVASQAANCDILVARRMTLKCLPVSHMLQAASDRHTCTPCGGLRNSGDFPGVQNLTGAEKDRTLRASDRLAPSSFPPPPTGPFQRPG